MNESEILARLAESEQRIAHFEQRIAELESELGRAGPATASGAAPAAPGSAAEASAAAEPSSGAGRQGLSRRGVLGAGAAAAAAGAAGLVAGAPRAAANNGANLVLGTYTNTATSATAIVATGSPGYGLGSIDTSYGGSFTSSQPAVFGYATGFAFTDGGRFESDNGAGGTGLSAISRGNSGIGVEATATGPIGAGVAAVATDPTGTGVLASGDHAALRLTPYSTSRTAPTNDATTHATGDVVADGDGNVWLCTTVGTPGTWRKLAGPATAGVLHVLPVPVRVYDSRAGAPPHVAPQTPLAANRARTLDLTVNGSGVPAGATAVLVTCMIVNAGAGSGNVTIWAHGRVRPASNTMVWGGTAGRASTQAVSAVDANAKVNVQANLATDLVLDVVGYYR